MRRLELTHCVCIHGSCCLSFAKQTWEGEALKPPFLPYHKMQVYISHGVLKTVLSGSRLNGHTGSPSKERPVRLIDTAVFYFTQI